MLGRETELDQLDEALRTHQLVTVLGMGGAGKSTLAHAFQQGDVENRIWVPLASTTDTADAIPRSIAHALGIAFTTTDDLNASMQELTRDRPLVLVLDNVEHLSHVDECVEHLVSATPTLSVVVTSRRRLDAKLGTVVELHGLGTDGPDGDDTAYALLRRHARRSAPGFPRDSAEEKAGRRLCRSLDGLPLAIEISAAMLDLVPIDSLVDDAELGAQLLDQTAGVHESLAGMLDRSMLLLTDDQQTSLRALTVFVDSFDLGAARVIANAELATMRHLVDHTLVTVVQAGRFLLHPVVIRYLRASNTDPEKQRQVELRHASYFAELLVSAEKGPGSGSIAEVSELADGDVANIVEAWRWSVENEQWQVVEVLAGPLHNLLQRTHQLHLANELFEMAMLVLVRQQIAPPVTAEIANSHAWVAWRRGDMETAKQRVEFAAKTADPAAVDLAVRIHRTEATIAMAEGDISRAQQIYEYAETKLGPESDPRLALLVQEGLGECARLRGDDDAARRAFRSAIDVGRRLGDDHIIARSHLMLGYVERRLSPKRALVLLTEGYQIAKERDFAQLVALFPSELGYAYLANDMYVEATVSFEEGLELNEGRDEAWLDSYNETGLAAVLVAQGSFDEARAMLRRSLRSARESGDWAAAIEALLESCALALRSAETSEVAGLLHSVIEHPASEYAHEQRARQLLAESNHAGDATPSTRLTASTRLDEATEAAVELLQFT